MWRWGMDAGHEDQRKRGIIFIGPFVWKWFLNVMEPCLWWLNEKEE